MSPENIVADILEKRSNIETYYLFYTKTLTALVLQGKFDIIAGKLEIFGKLPLYCCGFDIKDL
jgi:hypothetical protein